MQLSRRLALGGMAASLVVRAEAAYAQPVPVSTATGLRINDGDFAAARTTFRTRLRRRGASPQDFTRGERPPPGVQEITYTSGDLGLKAWMARPLGDALVPAVVFAHGDHFTAVAVAMPRSIAFFNQQT